MQYKINNKKRGRGRPQGSRNKSTINIKSDIKTIYIDCNKCKKTIEIRTNNLEIYTNEVKKNFVCLNCR